MDGLPIDDPAARPAAARVPARPHRALGAGGGRRGAGRAGRGRPAAAAGRAARCTSRTRCSACAASGWASSCPACSTMQVRAIAEAAAERIEGRRRPAAGDHDPAGRRRAGAGDRSARTPRRSSPRSPSRPGVEFPALIGTMIELPRAAMTAGRDRRGRRVLLLRHQRPHPDDVGLLPRRRRGGVLPTLPGQGHLRGLAVRDPGRRGRRRAGRDRAPSAGRATRPDLKLGVCGEHGGDPDSVHFFHEVGLDYVSCSPFRVPVARLEAGRVALEGGAGADSR